MTRAIFIDRHQTLTRCQLVGMNQKGEPEWLVIEQGKESKTLAAIQRGDFKDYKHRMFCIEGEKLDKLTLMRVLASAIEGEVRGYGFMIEDITDFVADMKKHHVEWPKDRIGLIFRFYRDYAHKGRYELSVSLGGTNGDILGSVDDIGDPNDWMETIRDFCYTLEDEAAMDEPYKELDISLLGDVEIDEKDLYMFNRVVRKD